MASRFWVGGTGTWDNASTTHWSASTGGANGASVPVAGDTVTLDGASGGGTVTANATINSGNSLASITCGAFTGTLDFSANNPSITFTAAASPFNGSGTGTRTINLGSGTFTFTSTANSTAWNFTTTTNLTFNANSSIIDLTANTAAGSGKTFIGGGLTYSTLRDSAQTNGGTLTITGANTFATLTITGQNTLALGANQTVTTLNLNGTSSGQVLVETTVSLTQQTLTVTTLSATWAAFRDIVMSGSALAATNSFDLGHNSGFTITAPSTAGMLVNPGMTGGMHG